MADFILDIAPNGDILAIYDDALAGLLSQGVPTITRASHVEPTPSGKWIADMTPAIQQFKLECDNPILGPFDLREEALRAERVWLEEKLFGVFAPAKCPHCGSDRLKVNAQDQFTCLNCNYSSVVSL